MAPRYPRKRLFLLILVILLLSACGQNSNPDLFSIFGSVSGSLSRRIENTFPLVRGILDLSPSRGAGSPRYLLGTFSAFYLSESFYCTNAVKIAEFAEPKEFDFIKDPAIVTANPTEGEYNCLIIKLSDVFEFKPNSTAVTANTGCDSDEVTYSFDKYLNGGSADGAFKDVDGVAIDATGSEVAPNSDTIYLFASTSPTVVSSGPLGAHADQVLSLLKPVRVPGSLTYVVDFSDKVTSSSSRCWLESATESMVFPSS